MIMGENGRLLCEGAAVEEPAGSRRWVYEVETAASTGSGQAVSEPVEVVVQAMDRPGNVGERRVACQL